MLCSRRLAIALALTFTVAGTVGAHAAPAPARQVQAPASRLRDSVRQELRSWASVFRSPRRFARFAATSAVAIGAGLVTQQLTGSPASSAFVSFVTGRVADRVADRLAPRSRALGASAPAPLREESTATLVGASVAAGGTALLLPAFEPLTQLAASAPGALGLGAQLVLSTAAVRSVTGFGAGLLAHGARYAVAQLVRARDAARRVVRSHGGTERPPS